MTVLDTTAEAASVQTQAQRRLGIAGRFRTAVEMSELTRRLARAGLRRRRPELNEPELEFELLRELYGVKPESEEAALDALARRRQFNVVDFVTGWKVDFIIVKDREFSRTEFDRRSLLELEGIQLYFASPEDVVIAKLEWAKLGASARQIEDAAGIIALQGHQLDTTYINHWVDALGLQQQWAAAQQRAG